MSLNRAYFSSAANETTHCGIKRWNQVSRDSPSKGCAVGRVDRQGLYDGHLLVDSLSKSITAAGHGSRRSRGRPCWYPPSSGTPSHTLHHSLISQRPGWDRTSNL